ncbi:restriction endonuclease subunit S [Pseudomonas weihenstephanensis]|uniref:Restriction endonuclease subunit S n=1 Tax=Pseudomonas weihenstephanensis TaxID=1608994 RepID=A0A0J6IBX7_9PSED|nr:restriction endonuclease subunit S [Pseudomonas weihenstephanensis]KMN12130.1 restriction endonuclease subunit S [Pseudomonas weihenstephanensis]
MGMAAYPAYDNYKDSCVEWIGVIPDHWEVRRSKFLFSQSKELARSNDIQLSATQSHGVIPQADYQDMVGRRVTQIQTNLEKRKHVEIDDFVISMRSFQGGIERAKAAGCIRSSYIILKPGPKIHPAFYAYVLKAPRYIQALQITGHFIRDGQDLNFENFSAVDLFVIPVLEQRAIAAFLDEKCARVDEAVRIKEQQIALLRERRQILIQHAVTRGLEPDVPMKDSGIDWIGKIPAHWAVQRNKHMFVEINERSAKGTEQHLSMSQKLGLVPANLVEKSLVSESYEGAKLVRVGDLVLNRLKAHLAVFSIAPMEGLVSPDYSVFRPFVDGASSQYYEALFKTSKYLGELRLRVRGIVEGFYRLYTDSFMDIPLLIPPRVEQDEIVAHLDQLASRFEAAISIKQDQISALKEYKTSLINAAITGKIKVI